VDVEFNMMEEDEDTQEYEEFMCGVTHAFAVTLYRLGIENDPDQLGYDLCEYWF
jgi:hypothetical protein